MIYFQGKSKLSTFSHKAVRIFCLKNNYFEGFRSQMEQNHSPVSYICSISQSMKFNLIQKDPSSSARAATLSTDHGNIETPIFMPVGRSYCKRCTSKGIKAVISSPILSWGILIIFTSDREQKFSNKREDSTIL